MSKRVAHKIHLPWGVTDDLRTDHSEEIEALRAETLRRMAAAPPYEATVEQAVSIAAFQTAAALLEVHDDTGISLDDWAGPRELVEYCLEAIGLGGRFLENHV